MTNLKTNNQANDGILQLFIWELKKVWEFLKRITEKQEKKIQSICIN